MLILGCGYIGRRVARRYLDRGESVVGVVRSARSVAELQRDGIPAIVCDLAVDSLAELPLAGERVLHLVPPPRQGSLDTLTRRLVSAFAPQGQPARLVYISTTGVYGDCGGAWVDESWPARPSADRARRRWDAEQTLGRWSLAGTGESAADPEGSGSAGRLAGGRPDLGAELVVLRVAGFYGPGRLPLERIRQGLPLVREQEAPYSNRIHADDLAQACVLAMERAEASSLYNVCDGNPSTMTDYFFRVADGAGLPRPPVLALADAAGELSPGMLSYVRESRRLSNRKLVEELGVALRFPTLDSGLEDCFTRG